MVAVPEEGGYRVSRRLGCLHQRVCPTCHQQRLFGRPAPPSSGGAHSTSPLPCLPPFHRGSQPRTREVSPAIRLLRRDVHGCTFFWAFSRWELQLAVLACPLPCRSAPHFPSPPPPTRLPRPLQSTPRAWLDELPAGILSFRPFPFWAFPHSLPQKALFL